MYIYVQSHGSRDKGNIYVTIFLKSQYNTESNVYWVVDDLRTYWRNETRWQKEDCTTFTIDALTLL